jgi:hypothetical protein
MKRLIGCFLLVVLVNACQQGPVTPRPVPSVAQIGEDLNCSTGDHGFEDSAAGWGFCYPASWRYVERAQGFTNPSRLDLTFDITDVPCDRPSPGASPSPQPVCSPGAGLFAFMIISTYDRAGVLDLVTWMQANLPSVPDRQAIVWGNASEADLLSDGRRIALTPTHVVIMDLRSGQGHLDLESQMSSRLSTWKFLY